MSSVTTRLTLQEQKQVRSAQGVPVQEENH